MSDYIDNVNNYINIELNSEAGITELLKLENYITCIRHEISNEELASIIQNEKLRVIIRNIIIDNDHSNHSIGKIGTSLINLYDPQREIIEKIKKGDKKARKKFIEDNQKLVIKIAYSYINSDIEVDDLIQEGMLGLIKALDMFDLKKGLKFSTYACIWIKSKIRNYILTESKTIRIPKNIQDKYIKYRTAYDILLFELNREPTLEEISNKCNIPIEELSYILMTQKRMISLDYPISEDTDTCLEELLDSHEDSPLDIYIKKELAPEVKRLIENSNLSDQEKMIIKYRFGFYGHTMTLEEIGHIYGVSRERIRFIETRALRKLKKSSEIDRVIEFADNPEKAKQYIKNIDNN